jgi:hypothetical protein
MSYVVEGSIDTDEIKLVELMSERPDRWGGFEARHRQGLLKVQGWHI